MAEQLQPDWALTGDLARYDFLAWMLECRPTLEWRQGPVWVKYGDEPGIVHADDGWQASSRWMIPGMTALVLPEGTEPDMLSTLPLKPDTQLLIFEASSFGKEPVSQWYDRAQKSGYPARIVLLDEPLLRSSTDLDADAAQPAAQRQCGLYRSAGKDAVCIPPPPKGESGPVLAVLNGRETDSQRWKRQLCRQLDSIWSLRKLVPEMLEPFPWDGLAAHRYVYSFDAFKSTGQKSIWLAYVSLMEHMLFDEQPSGFLKWAEGYYVQLGISNLLQPSFWNVERDRQVREKRLRTAYRQAVQDPALAGKMLASITAEEYDRQVAREGFIGKMTTAVQNYLKNTAPLILQKCARERYEQIRGALK